ncbi:DUF294 nucleotidyltransferase-like domain-containing protein [Pseudactinotalea sp. Z1739]|uniref:DUF294 nucleotidyltransferase-like domain-containing protein n=1 Tax=Pseudactinotalea sp. Z1739 TaxID=3413028 RepID=UPI003C7C2912
MDAELAEIRDFLAAHEPYQDLPPELLDELPRSLEVAYFRRGTVVVELGAGNDYVHILRSGAVDILDSLGALADRDEPGSSFGLSSVLTAGPSLYRIVAVEDSLCYLLPARDFRRLMARSDAFAQFFMRQQVGRLRDTVPTVHVQDPGSALLRTRISQLVHRAPVTTTPTATVAEATDLMEAEGVSALLVTEKQDLVGIFTDRDVRSRVVARGLPVSTAVSTVMTPDPVTIPSDRLAMEALAELTLHGFHHLPVIHNGGLLGVITAGDLMRLARDNPTLLLTEITKQTSTRALAAVVSRLPQVVSSATSTHAAPGDVSRLITAVADGVTRRLLHLAESDLGPPPMRYCWVVLGSQGRMETGLHSDQDNALVLARRPDRAESRYFAELAERVVDGLEASGYPRCPGDIMATNPRFRVPVDQWRNYLIHWIGDPEPQALLHAQIFFDMRPVSGDRSLFEPIRQVELERAPQSRLFLAHLAHAAQRTKPPLGFFREFVLERSGEQRATLDIKAGALAPITQIARLSALALGRRALSTVDRLQAAAGTRVLSADHAADLVDAHEFVTALRTRHQVEQHARGQSLNSRVLPAQLSPFERRHLKGAFAVVRRVQATLPYLYRTEMVS